MIQLFSQIDLPFFHYIFLFSPFPFTGVLSILRLCFHITQENNFKCHTKLLIEKICSTQSNANKHFTNLDVVKTSNHLSNQILKDFVILTLEILKHVFKQIIPLICLITQLF